MPSPAAYVFYHYLYPDDVVSSVVLSELGAGLSERGWDLTGFPCHRSMWNESLTFPFTLNWRGVSIRRIWRPAFSQSSALGRLLNSIWMTAAWSLLSFRSAPPSAVIVGTDPICSVLIAFAWKLIRPSTKIIHWCFDLYPEAAIADGLLPQQGFITRMLSRLMHAAYQRCDAIVDIGPCMRRRLSLYRSDALIATVTPWALAESAAPLPIHSDERQRIFGDTSLAVLYSGTMGRAHSYESLLEVARRLRHHNIGFAFSVRGNRTSQLAQAIRPEDRNVRLVPFADQGRLGTRLAAADIHVVSLRESWTGTVIPSKFFGALAAGRPVLFVGSKDSAIAQWIEQFNLGWVLPEHASNLELDCLAECLRELAGNSQRLHDMFLRCHDVYMRHFSRDIILNRWDELLRRLTSAGAPAF